MIVVGGDVPLLAEGSKQASAEAREMMRGHVPSGKPPASTSLYG